MRQGVEPVFNLARLFADGIQRAGIINGICLSGAAERRLRAQVVSCRPSDLSHRVVKTGVRGWRGESSGKSLLVDERSREARDVGKNRPLVSKSKLVADLRSEQRSVPF